MPEFWSCRTKVGRGFAQAVTVVVVVGEIVVVGALAVVVVWVAPMQEHALE